MTAWERVKQESFAAIDRINSALSGDRGEPERTLLPVFDRDGDLQRALAVPLEDAGLRWRAEMGELDAARCKARAAAAAASGPRAAMPPAPLAQAAPVQDRMLRSPIDRRPGQLLARPGRIVTNTKEFDGNDPVEEYFDKEENNRRVWGPVDYKLRLLKAMRFRDLPNLAERKQEIDALCARFSAACNMADGPGRAAALDAALGDLYRAICSACIFVIHFRKSMRASRINLDKCSRALPINGREPEARGKNEAVRDAARRVGNDVGRPRPYRQGRGHTRPMHRAVDWRKPMTKHKQTRAAPEQKAAPAIPTPTPTRYECDAFMEIIQSPRYHVPLSHKADGSPVQPTGANPTQLRSLCRQHFTTLAETRYCRVNGLPFEHLNIVLLALEERPRPINLDSSKELSRNR